MERLLADAQEISGVQYDMSNLGDVYEAIHVIQGELGLTGVAAAEAEGTFTGSMGAMKAAAENLMANLALGESIEEPLNQLMGNAQAFVINNLAPMIGNIAAALPSLLEGLSSGIIQFLNIGANHADELVNSGIEVVSQLAVAIISALPYLAEAAINLVLAFGEALFNADWATIGNSTMESLRNAISLAAAEILGTDDSTLQGILTSLTNGIDQVLSKGVEIISQLANGLIQGLPKVITSIGSIVTQLMSFLMQNSPKFLQAGMDIIKNMATGLVNNLPQIVSAIATVISNLITTILNNLPQILATAVEIIVTIAGGLIEGIPLVIAAIIQLIGEIGKNLLNYDWLTLGKNIIEGIGQGILNAAEWLANTLWNAVGGAIDGVKSKLGIHSPSIYMADVFGKNMALGIGVGFDDTMDKLNMANSIKSSVTKSNVVSGVVRTDNRGIDYATIYEAVKAGAEAAHLEIDIDGRDLTRTLKGLGVAMA